MLFAKGNKAGLRVVQLGPYAPPRGGVQVNLEAIHSCLMKHGHFSRVINITANRKHQEKNIYYPRNWLALLFILFRLSCDILHLHIGGRVTPRLLALSLICCALPGRKAVLTFHSGGYPSSKEGLKARSKSMAGFVFRKFDSIIGVNQEIVQLFHRFGVVPDKVKLIQPHALPSELPDRDLPTPLKDFFEAHKPILLTVSGLEQEYDIAVQIDVFGLVLKQYPSAGLAIIGSGNSEELFRNMIAHTSYKSHILLCGDMPHEDTLLAIRACDLFLRTSRYDGDSIAVREALHFGIPVIATDTGMRPSQVHLVPVSNPIALRQAIEKCLLSPCGDRQLGRASEKNIEAVVELYQELLHEGGKHK